MCRDGHSRRNCCRLLVWLALSLAAANTAAAGGDRKARRSSAPDGVCYPVDGTGYTVAQVDGIRIPVGTLSPLVAGDSLVVQTGTVTFVDFRTGERPVYGAGTRLKIPPAKKPKPPSWVKRLEDHIIRSLHDSERDRIAGSVRGGVAAFWPDSVRFSPDVPIVLEWAGVAQTPAVLRVCAGADTTETPVVAECPNHGVFTWRPAAPATPGEVSWVLLGADGRRLGGGCFEVLTAAAAEAERERFRRAAAGLFAAEVVGLTSAVLAEADRSYLW